MGERRGKGLALARYLTGHTGIPLLSWNGAASKIDAPFPYTMEVATARKLDTWHAMIRGFPEDSVAMAIRYDHSVPTIDQAWVGMQLRPFTTLLAAHYDTIRHRGEQE